MLHRPHVDVRGSPRRDSGENALLPCARAIAPAVAELQMVRYVTVMRYLYGYDYERQATIELDQAQLDAINTGSEVALTYEFDRTPIVRPTEDQSHLLPIAEDEEYLDGWNEEMWYRQPSRANRRSRPK